MTIYECGPQYVYVYITHSFYIDCSLYKSVYDSHGPLSLNGINQAAAILAEGGSSSVRHPKDGALCRGRGFVDERQLRSLRREFFLNASLKTSWTFNEIWNTSNFQLEITGTAIWINPFIGVLTIISLWPVAIIFMNTNRYLRGLNMVPKYAMYQVSQRNHYHMHWICIYFSILSGLEENLFVYFNIWQHELLCVAFLKNTRHVTDELLLFPSASACIESAADVNHQHPGLGWNHRLLPSLLLSSSWIQ